MNFSKATPSATPNFIDSATLAQSQTWTGMTDSGGMTGAGLVFPSGTTSTGVNVSETQQSGYALVPVGGTQNAVCVDSNTGNSVTAPNYTGDGTGKPGFTVTASTTTAPRCTIYNRVMKDTTLNVSKQLNGARGQNTDQFTVGFRNSAGTAGTYATPATTTTTGTGQTVTSGTGTTGASAVTAGSTWYPFETGSGTGDLSKYSSTITCTDANNIATGLPTNAALTNGVYTAGITLPAESQVSCVVTNALLPTLQVTKMLSGSRVANTDQFTVGALSGTSGTTAMTPASGSQPTTTGTGSTVTTGTGGTGAVPVAVGTWRPREVASGTTNLAQYTSTVTCTDSAGLATGLPTNGALTGGVYTAGITLPLGAKVSCVITNAALQPTLQVAKALSGSRVANTDQFTAGALSGTSGTTAMTPATGSQPTTTGTGSTVTSGTGSTGVVTVAAGSVWRPRELAAGTANLAQYTSTVTCTDANSIATGLPSNQALTGGVYTAGITLPAGAKVSCVITNTILQPILQVSKVMSGSRRLATDQFTAGALSGTSGTTAMTPATGSQPTTTGTGSTVTSGTGSTGAVSVAAGSVWRPREVATGTANLAQYTSTVTCTDANSIATGLPSNQALTGGVYTAGITLPAGANVSCVVTNTAKMTTFIEKLAQNNANAWVQFPGSQWQILADNSGAPGSTATGVTVSAVSGQTALFQVDGLVPNTPYWLVETQTPQGFSLLAQPVQFTVASSGAVTLGNSAGSGASATVTAAAGTGNQAPWYVMSVKDVPNAHLPAAGGTGTGPVVWASAVLLAVGVALAALTWRRRKRGRGEAGTGVTG